jgi:hypothetical protein
MSPKLIPILHVVVVSLVKKKEKLQTHAVYCHLPCVYLPVCQGLGRSLGKK